MKTLAGEIGEPLPKVAIAWVLANPTVASAILGASRTDQLTDTLGAVDLEVPAELKQSLTRSLTNTAGANAEVKWTRNPELPLEVG